MPPPVEISQWLQKQYPKPRVDPEWLEGCYNWITESHQLDPATQLEEIIGHVNTQLLSSDFTDSMLRGTGLSPNVNALKKCTMKGLQILLELVSLTEIAHSAFNLMNVRQTRIDREDLAGLGAGDEAGDADEDEGPVPKFPRGMLKMQLTDGQTILNAIEYRRIPELELGVTPLGCKILVNNINIRNGIALLEPKNTTVLGYKTDDREAEQDANFLASLKRRLDIRDDEPPANGAAHPPPGPPPAPAPQAPPQQIPQPVPQPPRQPLPQAPPPQRAVRSPLREMTPPLDPGPSRVSHIDDEEQPRRRKVPARRSPSPPIPAPTASGSRPTHSRFFHASTSSESTLRGDSADLADKLRLSPHREEPTLVNNSQESAAEWQVAGSSKAAVAASSSTIPQQQTNVNRNDDEEIPTDQSSDIDYDAFDVGGGQSFYAEVDRAEQEALSQLASQASQQNEPQAPRTAPLTQAESIVFIGMSQRPPGTAPPRRGRNPNSHRDRDGGITATQRARIDLGIIDIADEEDGEKENVPVQSRHVRRRVEAPTTQRARDDDVIEISD
ncbi:hypothetical protein QCA50_006011 [Cerrena zonata]|uniref:RecQ-mediated genome instability protein 1 n=1 Tax=Cerrena zonata TaxID=2478898 RepID=A0AAW0GBI1_9APHY